MDAIAEMGGIREACEARQAEQASQAKMKAVAEELARQERIAAQETVANITADVPLTDDESTQLSGLRLKGDLKLLAKPLGPSRWPAGPCYIGSRMRNVLQFNFPAFYEAEERLASEGAEVGLNPARYDVEVRGFDYRPWNGTETAAETGFDYIPSMINGLEYIATTAAWVCVFGDWRKSDGTLAEIAHAKSHKKPVYELETGRRIDEHSPGEADGNPKDAIGSTKVPLSLIPPIASVEESLALLEGLLKYGAHNYRGIRVRASIYLDAAARHEAKYRDGESRDPETGIHHLGYAKACMSILMDAELRGMLIDDRPPRCSALSARMESAREAVAKLNAMYGDCKPKHWTIADGCAG